MNTDAMVHASEIRWMSTAQPQRDDAAPAGDVFDVLASQTKQLAALRYELYVVRSWFRAALDTLHEQYQEIERQRRQLAALRDEIRQLRKRSEAA